MCVCAARLKEDPVLTSLVLVSVVAHRAVEMNALQLFFGKIPTMQCEENSVATINEKSGTESVFHSRLLERKNITCS